MKPMKVVNNGIAKKYAMVDLVMKKHGRKEFPNVYVKFKEDCIEFSDCEDFNILMYIPYSDLVNVELKEE